MEISTLLNETKNQIQLWRSKKECNNQKIPSDLREKIKTLAQNYPKGFLSRELKLSTSLFSNRKSQTKKSSPKNPEFVPIPIHRVDFPRNSPSGPKTEVLVAKLNFPGGIEVRIYHGDSL